MDITTLYKTLTILYFIIAPIAACALIYGLMWSLVELGNFVAGGI